MIEGQPSTAAAAALVSTSSQENPILHPLVSFTIPLLLLQIFSFFSYCCVHRFDLLCACASLVLFLSAS